MKRFVFVCYYNRQSYNRQNDFCVFAFTEMWKPFFFTNLMSSITLVLIANWFCKATVASFLFYKFVRFIFLNFVFDVLSLWFLTLCLCTYINIYGYFYMHFKGIFNLFCVDRFHLKIMRYKTKYHFVWKLGVRYLFFDYSEKIPFFADRIIVSQKFCPCILNDIHSSDFRATVIVPK